MNRRVMWGAALGLAIACGCATQGEGAVAHAKGDAANDDTAGGSTRGAQAPAGSLTSLDAGRGHVAAITQLTATDDGEAAITADAAGQTRYWPSLGDGTKGSSPPLALELRAPASMAIAPHSAGGHRLAFVDASGGGRAIRGHANHQLESLFELPPTRPLAQLEPIRVGPGDGYLALTRDRFVLLLDARGAVIQEWAAPRFPIDRFEQHGARIFVMAPLSDDEGAYTELRELKVHAPSGDQAPSLVAAKTVTKVRGPTTALQIDAANERVWILEPAASGQLAVLRREALGSKAPPMRYTFKGRFTSSMRLGLDAQRRPILETPGVGMLAFDPDTQRTHGLSIRVDEAAAARWINGRRYSGFGSYLAIEAPQLKPRYLGFRSAAGFSTALSTDAREVAWARPGELGIEDLSQGTLRRIARPIEVVPMGLAWTATGALVVANANSGFELIDPRTGETLDTLEAGGHFSDWQMHPSGRVFAWRSHTWGTRHVVEVGADAFGEAHAIQSQHNIYGPWLDGERPGLWTFDGTQLHLISAKRLAAGEPVDATTETESTMRRAPAPNTNVALPLNETEAVWGHFAGSPSVASLTKTGPKNEKAFELELGPGAIFWLRASANKSQAFALTNSEGARVLYAVDLARGSVAWSRAVPPDASASMATGGGTLLLSSVSSGRIVISASDGSTLNARCGFEFESGPRPPALSNGVTQDACAEF